MTTTNLAHLPRPASTTRTALLDLERALAASSPERGTQIRAILTALIAGQHVLVLGEPGTGKSRLCDQVAAALDASFFDYLMTRTTEPAEIFGAVKIKRLADDGQIELNTVDRLPEAHIAFLDEVFKSSSAILNTLLKLLNERRFYNDGAWRNVPLRICIAASNEVPEEGDTSVAAFFDRFLVRLFVEPLENDDHLFAMLDKQLPSAPTKVLTIFDIDVARGAALALPLADSTKRALAAIRRDCRAAGIIVSDRRWNQIADFLRATAWMAGAKEVGHGTVSGIACCLWSRLDQKAKAEEIVAKHAPSWEADLRTLNAVVDEQLAVLARVDGMTKDAAMTALGGIHQVLDEKLRDLDDVVAKAPEATAAGAQLRARVDGVKDRTINKSIEIQKRRA